MKGRAKHITTGAALQKEDDKTRSVRIQDPLAQHHDGPVDYEKLCRYMREDGGVFWQEFLKVQKKLCQPCLSAFTEAMQTARRKAYGRSQDYGVVDGNDGKKSS